MEWQLPKEMDVKNICKNLKMNKKIANVFANRNMSEKDIKDFLNFSEKDIPSFYEMKDSKKLVEELIEIINLQLKTVIMTDHDADGITGGSLAYLALKYLGAIVEIHTNNKFVEGYGMKKESVDAILKKWPDTQVILTVDNGIVSFDAVEYAKEKGLKVLITDHHLPSEDGKLPNADAVVDHKRLDDNYPFKEICGVAIVYKLMQELYKEMGKELDYVYSLLPLVCIGTIADCMEMKNENRYYVKEGLKMFGNSNIPAINVLSELFNIKTYNEETVAFYYAPCLNASARVTGEAKKAIDFFLTQDDEKAKALGIDLFNINEKRKKLASEQTDMAIEQIVEENLDSDKVIVLLSPKFSEGIVGIIAGHITEQFNKPAVVFTENNGTLKGSARSIESFNIKNAFDNLKDLTLNYGGHAMAAGISIDKSNLVEFRKKINELAKDLEIKEKDNYNIEINLENPDEISLDFIEDFNNYLRPFGPGWEKPLIRVGNFVADYNTVKYLKDVHLKVTNTLNEKDYSLLMFNTGAEFYKNLTKNLNGPQKLEAIGNVDVNVFRGDVSYQVIVNDKLLRVQN